MLPNLSFGPLEFLGLKLYPFGFLVGLAIVAGTMIAGKRARKLGLSEKVVADVALWAVAGGFIGAHLYSAIFYFPERIVEDPLYLIKIWDGISSIGGFIGATLSVLWYFRRNKELPFWPYADSIIYGFAFAWIFGRMGCTIAFDHPGSVTDFALGMEYLGSRDVSAGIRHNLGMYEAVWAISMATFFWSQRNKSKVIGWYLGTFVVAYMPLRFAADFLRRADATHLGLTAAQWAAIPLFLLGAWIIRRGYKRGEYLEPDGIPKFRPAGELKRLEEATATASGPKVGASKPSKKGKKKR